MHDESCIQVTMQDETHWHSAWCRNHTRSYALTAARDFEKRYSKKDVTWQWALIYGETMRMMIDE